MEGNNVVPIVSIEQFTTEVVKKLGEWKANDVSISMPRWTPWFRAEPATTSTSLVPKLYRKDLRSRHERTLLRFVRKTASRDLGPTAEGNLAEWVRQGVGPIPSKRRDFVEWLYLVEYIGLPTRLLAWTEDALVALYFAVLRRRNGCVWMLHPLALNRASDLVELDRPSLKKHRSGANFRAAWQIGWGWRQSRFPIAVQPTHVYPRFRVQKTCFTVHGSDHRGVDVLMAENGMGRYLHKFEIDAARQEELLAALAVLVSL